MERLSEQNVSCPYCGEALSILVDPEEVGDAYIEDCQVCCRPMTVVVEALSGGSFRVMVSDENSAL